MDSRVPLLIRTNTPGPRLRVVLPDDRRGRSEDYRVVRNASHHYGIDSNNTVTAYCQLSSCADDGRSTADPRPLANSDLAIPQNALIDDWHSYIFVRVIMVCDDDLLGDEHITL